MKQFSILVVDDDNQICKILHDFLLHEGYSVAIANNGKSALDLIKVSLPNLVISDIQMPLMDGFELLSILKSQFPSVKHIMMTSFDIDQYIKHMRKFNIGNVLAKGSDFNLSEVAAYVKAILTGDVFGIERYFLKPLCKKKQIKNYAEAKKLYGSILSMIPGKKGFFLEIAIDELIANAIFHGSLNLSKLPREQWSENLNIPEAFAIKIAWCVDEEKIGISIEDPRGKLKKTDVLKWLDTYSNHSQDNEEHGRGLFLVRRLIDRLIINILPGKRTECIIIQYLNRNTIYYNKPLLVHEL